RGTTENLIGGLQGFANNLNVVGAKTIDRIRPGLTSGREEQLVQLNPEGLRKPVHRINRRIPFAALDLADELVAEAGALGQFFLSDSERETKLTQALANLRANHLRCGCHPRPWIMRTAPRW